MLHGLDVIWGLVCVAQEEHFGIVTVTRQLKASYAAYAAVANPAALPPSAPPLLPPPSPNAPTNVTNVTGPTLELSGPSAADGTLAAPAVMVVATVVPIGLLALLALAFLVYRRARCRTRVQPTAHVDVPATVSPRPNKCGSSSREPTGAATASTAKYSPE